MLSRVPLFAAPWIVAHQAPLPTGFSRQEYWSGWPCPSPGDPPNPGIEVTSTVASALVVRIFTAEPLGKPPCMRTSLQFRGAQLY